MTQSVIDGINVEQRGLIITSNKVLAPNDIEFLFSYISEFENTLLWARLDLYMYCVNNGLDPWDYIDPSQVSEGTIQNGLVAWRLWPTPASRVWRLRLSHYIVAANHKLTWDERCSFLDDAEMGKWSRNTLAEEIKRYLSTDDVQPAPRFVPRRAYTTFTMLYNRYSKLLTWAETSQAPSYITDGAEDILTEAGAELSILGALIEGEKDD